MFSFIARRIGLLIPTFFGITLLTFALIRMIPGDPVEVMMGERRVDPEMHAQAMERLGLNKPLYEQYFDYVTKLAHGDLGESLRTRESVWTEFSALFPATLELSMAALLFAGILGLLAGVIAALNRSFIDSTAAPSTARIRSPSSTWPLPSARVPFSPAFAAAPCSITSRTSTPFESSTPWSTVATSYSSCTTTMRWTSRWSPCRPRCWSAARC